MGRDGLEPREIDVGQRRVGDDQGQRSARHEHEAATRSAREQAAQGRPGTIGECRHAHRPSAAGGPTNAEACRSDLRIMHPGRDISPMSVAGNHPPCRCARGRRSTVPQRAMACWLIAPERPGKPPLVGHPVRSAAKVKPVAASGWIFGPSGWSRWVLTPLEAAAALRSLRVRPPRRWWPWPVGVRRDGRERHRSGGCTASVHRAECGARHLWRLRASPRPGPHRYSWPRGTDRRSRATAGSTEEADLTPNGAGLNTYASDPMQLLSGIDSEPPQL